MQVLILYIFFFVIANAFSKESFNILDYTQKDLCIKDAVAGFNTIDQIYIINLAIRYERWLNVQKQLEPFNINPQRVDGINGWTLDRKKMKVIYKKCIQKPYDKQMTPGQIGCILSHLSILNDAFKKKYKCIWVLEDDVLVLEDLRELDSTVEALGQFDPHWDILYTDASCKGTTFDQLWTLETFVGSNFNYSIFHDKKFILYENEWFKRIEYRLGTHSMIISDRGIKKLLEYYRNNRIMFPIDVQIHCCSDKHFYVSKKEYVTNGKREVSDTTYDPNL